MRKSLRFVAISFIFVPAMLAVAEQPVTWKTTERLVVKADDAKGAKPNTVQLSPTGLRVAFVRKLGKNQEAVVIDGKQQKTYRQAGEILLGPNDKHDAYFAKEGTGEEEKWVLVVDGKEVEKFFYRKAGRISITKSGVRFAYCVLDSKQYFVITEKGRTPCPEFPMFFAVSNDLKHHAYSSFSQDKKTKTYTSHVFKNGKKGPGYFILKNASLTFSPDSKRFAYIVLTKDPVTTRVILDGKKLPSFGSVSGLDDPNKVPGTIAFSPDSKRFAFPAARYVTPKKGTPGKSSYSAVVDGVAHRTPGMVYWPVTFSPNSKHWACVVAAKSKGKGFAATTRNQVIRDGKPEPLLVDLVFRLKYTYPVGRDNVVFSPDGKRLAYLASIDKKTRAIVDGKPLKHHADLTLPVFSSDSKRLAYVAQRKPMGKVFAVVNGVEHGEYDAIAPLTLGFSDDSKHVFYRAQVGKQFTFVIDGKERGRYDSVGGGRNKIIIGKNSIRYLARRGGNYYHVVESKQ